MIHNIARDTFIDASPETARALTYDLFKGLYEKVDNLLACHHQHMDLCNTRFKDLENRKIKDTIIASGSGFLGGVAAGLLALYNHIFGK
jgi:hypothetical protein